MNTVFKTIYFLLCATYDTVNFCASLANTGLGFHLLVLLCDACTQCYSCVFDFCVCQCSRCSCSVACECCTVKPMDETLNQCQPDTLMYKS